MNHLGVAREITKSDTPNATFNMLLVQGIAGSIVVGLRDGTEVTYTNIPVGVWIPTGDGVYVGTTSTATGILVV